MRSTLRGSSAHSSAPDVWTSNVVGKDGGSAGGGDDGGELGEGGGSEGGEGGESGT